MCTYLEPVARLHNDRRAVLVLKFICNTKFIIFSTKFVIFNAKFIIFSSFKIKVLPHL